MNKNSHLKLTLILVLLILLSPGILFGQLPGGDEKLTDEEYGQTHKRQRPPADLPAAFDWRDKDIVTPAKNQGTCHGSWAFAAVGAMEAKIKMAVGQEYDLAEEQQIKCNTKQKGCTGGNLRCIKLWQPVAEGGDGYKPVEEINAPFGMMSPSECPFKPQLNYCVGEYYTVNTRRENQIKTSLILDGPAYFRFELYRDFMRFWNNGLEGDVYTHRSGRYLEGHAVLLIGWDDTKGAWLCKNSWGKDAGPNKDGTFWIAYEAKHVISLIFQMANFTITSLPPPTPVPVICGDANCDGIVNIVDALVIAQATVGNTAGMCNLWAANVYCDGILNIVDALMVAQHYVYKVVTLNCCPVP